MIPPEPGAFDHSKRQGPQGWSGPLAALFIILGLVFAFLLYRVYSFARASSGSSAEITLTPGDILLLGGGSLACFAIAATLIIWRRRR